MKKYYDTELYHKVRNWFFAHVMNPWAYYISSKYQIMDSMDSIQYIIDHKCSLSRYGDGEFYVMMGKGNGFQDPNPRLAGLLKHVITSNDAPNHKVAIPLAFKDRSYLMDGWPIFFWSFYMGKNIRFIDKYVKKDYTYLNTQLSRFYYEVKDKSNCGKQISLLKQIWEGRDVVMVEGCQTRSGVGNDLFDNVKSFQRILGPSTNAIDKYEKMLDAITEHVSKDRLILLSFGMLATVLAYDLAKLGYQAIDLGHLDIEYEWFRQGVVLEMPIPVKGKYTNEANGGDDVTACEDPLYRSQIICDLS